VILTHGDSDHIGGLDDLLRSYKIDKFFSNGYLEAQVEQKIYSQKIGQNDIISIGLFEFEVVWPPSIHSIDSRQASSGLKDGPANSSAILAGKNENSVVGILNWLPAVAGQEWSMFMSGDMDAETEQRLVWRETLRPAQDQMDVLKVSHHGSATGTSDEILEILSPKVAVISVGKNNQFGHPNDDILKKLEDKNIEILRTDMNGEILFKL
jgi:competence protein ComEC